MDGGVRDLRNRTTEVVAAIEAGEWVTLTVRGDAVAEIVPHGRRSRWLGGSWLEGELEAGAADPALAVELDRLAGQALDEP